MKMLVAFLLLCPAAFAQVGSNLVPPSSATDTAVLSGSWQDGATWTDGTVPAAGEKVYIPAGITVTNHATTADVLWIHIAGMLTTCDHCDTQLNVHTLYVPMGGRLNLGSMGMPRTGKTVVEFTGGQFLPGDWQKVSGGEIVHGEFSACGNEKTAWDVIDGDLAIGATSLLLQNVPYGWQVGDTIAIAGTDALPTKYQTEFLTITAVSGRQVSWSQPLAYRHFRWRSDLPFHCANISRNVVIRSRQADVPNRGHLMFMSSAVDLRYTEIKDCGRTDKSQPVSDPRLDAYGAFIAGSDSNPRARYACHWHRVGELGSPASVRGCVVNGSPGWGFLNHKSNVQIDDCVALNCFGFGFGTEEGQERGHFRRCVSFLNKGQGDTITSTDDDHGRRQIGDWGTDGSGFWLQGGLVEVSDCVSFDNSGRGFALFNQCLNGYPDYGLGSSAIATWIQFPIEVSQSLLPAEYLQTPWWQYAVGTATPPTGQASGFVPIRAFARNTAYNCKVGLQSWSDTFAPMRSSRVAWPLTVRGSITDTTLWGRGSLCHVEYTRQLNIDGLKVVGIGAPGSQDTQLPGLILRRAEITVSRYECVNRVRVNERGTAAEAATHIVQP